MMNCGSRGLLLAGVVRGSRSYWHCEDRQWEDFSFPAAALHEVLEHASGQALRAFQDQVYVNSPCPSVTLSLEEELSE
eukprot:2649708-Amphidinium_carterae.1